MYKRQGPDLRGIARSNFKIAGFPAFFGKRREPSLRGTARSNFKIAGFRAFFGKRQELGKVFNVTSCARTSSDCVFLNIASLRAARCTEGGGVLSGNYC